MKPARRVLVALIAPTLGAIACVDLFHDTNFATLCDERPSAEGCPAAEAGDTADANPASDAETRTCISSRIEAEQQASRLCASESACGVWRGRGGLGTCMFHTLRVLACDAETASPRDARAALTACRRDATSCEAVRACLGITSSPCSPITRSSCAGRTAVKCGSDGPEVTPCAALGNACVAQADGTSAACGVAEGMPCSPSGESCEGTTARTCTTTGVSYTLECKDFGAGRCADRRCVPNDAPACASDTPDRCDGEVATRCRRGLQERIDCAAYGLRCVAGITRQSQADLSELCGSLAVNCTESCDGSVAVSCFRNHAYRVDCAAAGLGPCQQSAGGNVYCTQK